MLPIASLINKMTYSNESSPHSMAASGNSTLSSNNQFCVWTNLHGIHLTHVNFDDQQPAAAARDEVEQKSKMGIYKEQIDQKPSFYSKTVHIESGKEDHKTWDKKSGREHEDDDQYDDDDDDDDSDSDSDYDEHHSKAKMYKRKKKKHRKPVKKMILVKGHEKYPGRKVVLVKHSDKHSKQHHDHDHEHHYHHNHQHYQKKGHKKKKQHYKSPHKHHKYKYVSLNPAHRGKISLAGVLGYTMLCVNYFLVLKQPTYSKYAGHYYDKYAPDSHYHDHHHHYHSPGAHNALELKSPGGPIILAHCGELPEPRELMHLASDGILTASQRDFLSVLSPRADRVDVDLSNPQNTLENRGVLFPFLDRILGDGQRQLQRQPGSPPMVDGRPLRQVPNDEMMEPQIVGTRDNLAGLRRRTISIGLRVIETPRFQVRSGPWLPSRVPANDDGDGEVEGRNEAGGRTNQFAPGNRVEAAGEFESNETPDGRRPEIERSQQQQQQQQPDHILSGDSIELACNHQLTEQRLAAVRWFRGLDDEIFRFIPGAGGTTTSNLDRFARGFRVDLARSNAFSLVLRNLSHRASGNYRCEVVPDSPGADLLSGSRWVEVFSLPSLGPRLNLMSGEQPSRFEGEREPNGAERAPASNINEIISSVRQRQQLNLDGPIVRCLSDRSNPAAKLTFFINDQPIQLDRTLENSTFTYSDGLESNVGSFRLRMSDFLANEDDAVNRLAKAASLKVVPPAAPNQTQVSTSRSTTAAPISMKQKSSSEQKKINNSTDPNQAVKFDDQRELEMEKKPKSKNKKKKKKSEENNNRNQVKQNKITKLDSQPTEEKLSLVSIKADESTQQLATAEQQQIFNSIYRNFVKIRCVASIISLGYELVSELNVPLTLLVPMRRLEDFRQHIQRQRSTSRSEQEATRSANVR